MHGGMVTAARRSGLLVVGQVAVGEGTVLVEAQVVDQDDVAEGRPQHPIPVPVSMKMRVP